jgi:hypothetical protein
MRIRTALFCTVCLLGATYAIAQQLPPTSRTVFKCKEGGKVVYTDSPCLGAEKIEVEPTRGLNAGSGKERIGKDVRRELDREGLANALRPITGMDAKQFDTFGRRTKLTAEAQQECRRLDHAIPAAEQDEKQVAAAGLPSAQQRLFTLRARYRELRC